MCGECDIFSEEGGHTQWSSSRNAIREVISNSHWIDMNWNENVTGNVCSFCQKSAKDNQ